MSARPGVAPRPLLFLGALVGLLHWWALKDAPFTLDWTRRTGAQPLKVRTVEAVAVGLASPGGTTATVKPSPPGTELRSQRRASATSPEQAAAPRAEPAPLPPPAVALPHPARWHYSVTALHRGAGVRGSAELAWWHDGAHYEVTLRIDAPPLPARVQRSVGEVQPLGLAPLRFSERSRTEEAAHFDREGGRIVFSGQGAPTPLQPGAQDRLSVLLQLGALLSGDPQRWSEGDSVLVQTATSREAQDWRFTIDGQETLALPAGPTAAIKLTRAPQREYEPRLELWLVPGRDYAPARLRLTAPNGEWLDLQWSGTDKG